MNSKYFILLYRLDQIDRYLIWYTHDIDRLLVDKNGYVPSFANLSSLDNYAKKNLITLEAEAPLLHNLDQVKKWVDNPKKSNINCQDFLAAWNLFTDLAVSVEDITFDCQSQLTNNIYDKLFWGNNLPAVTPGGKHYQPIWTDEELEILHKILNDGLLLFHSRVAHRPDNGGHSIALLVDMS